MYNMQTKTKKTSSSRQYIATGIIGIFAIISGLIVIQKKSLQTYARTTSFSTINTEIKTAIEWKGKKQTLQTLCLQEKCARQEVQEECFCKQ